MSERFLVTGALGCIGAWTCAALVEEGTLVVGYDLGTDVRRLKLATSVDVPLERGDIADRHALERVLDKHKITHVIHLAALLIPMIKRDPVVGTAVNVGGTVNVLDAAKTRGIQVAFASSIAVYSRGDGGGGPVASSAIGNPTSFYGVHKQACEGLARIYWQDEHVPSIGIRPSVVYGPGRDNGLTASPTLAMAAAAAGLSSRIGFGGRAQMQYAPDAARVFVAAARAATEGSSTYQLGGPVVAQQEVASAIERVVPGVAVTVDETRLLPFPEDFDGSALEGAIGPIDWTPLDEGVAETIERLRLTSIGAGTTSGASR